MKPGEERTKRKIKSRFQRLYSNGVTGDKSVELAGKGALSMIYIEYVIFRAWPCFLTDLRIRDSFDLSRG